ncbi:uncharacterized protein [Watersipora subatra]|uniref:uncharacterized protein isoform X2 n=1 Tax=Watersipora subatra TaxID=2589382 RepID=UPI00355C5149
MDESLLELLKCLVCKEIDQLRVLPCQHTICLPCVRLVTVEEGRYKCPTCNKEHTIPNGGFDKLPVSLITKQLYDILKRKEKTQQAAAKPSELGGRPRKTSSLSALTSKGGFGSVPVKKPLRTLAGKDLLFSTTAADVMPQGSTSEQPTNSKKKSAQVIEDSSTSAGADDAVEHTQTHLETQGSLEEPLATNPDNEVEQRPARESPRKETYKSQASSKEHAIPNGEFSLSPVIMVSEKAADNLKSDIQTPETVTGPSPSEKVEQPKTHKDEVSALLAFKGGFGFIPARKCADQSLSSSTAAVIDTASRDSSAKKKSKKRKRKKARSAEDIESKTISTDAAVEPAFTTDEVAKLKQDLDEAYNKAQEFCQKADAQILCHATLLNCLEEHAEVLKGRIKQYKKGKVELCRNKLDDIEQALASKEVEIRKYLQPVHRLTGEMDSAITQGSSALHSLLGESPGVTAIAEAQRCAFHLKDLNNSVRRQDIDLEDSSSIRRGDSVRLKRNLDLWKNMEEFLQEKVSHKSVGVFFGISKEEIPNPNFWLFGLSQQKTTILVQFPECLNWERQTLAIEKALTKGPMPVVGDKVKLNSSAHQYTDDEDEYLPKDSIGILTEVKLQNIYHGFLAEESDVYMATVNFPNISGFTHCDVKYTQIDLVTGCPFVPGQKVRVRRSIPRPSRGWGGINRSSVGSVIAVTGTEECETIAVKFPECKDWIGAACDLEPVLKLKEGEKVQLKLSVDCAKKRKRWPTHGMVGELEYWSYARYSSDC